MKNLKLCILLFAALIVFSCSDDELKYSCDPEVDKYVSENLASLKSADLDEITTYDNEVQRAAYRAFTSEKRYALWIEKLGTLANYEQYSTEEQAHITDLKNELSVELFDPANTNAFASFTVFFNEWENIAYTELGWDKLMVAFVVSALTTNYDDFLANIIATPNTTRAGENCYCNQSSDYCSSGTWCENAVCTNDSDTGCGVLWLEPCDGTCK